MACVGKVNENRARGSRRIYVAEAETEVSSRDVPGGGGEVSKSSRAG